MQTIEAYWMPGCSSCLRMKEFLEKSGLDFVAINVDEHPEAKAKLAKHGVLLPATCVGDRCVNGVDLASVAELVGVEYRARRMLRIRPVRSPRPHLRPRRNLWHYLSPLGAPRSAADELQ